MNHRVLRRLHLLKVPFDDSKNAIQSSLVGGPLQQVETLNAQNRLKVMTALLFIYNQQLSFINKSALEQLCKVATK